MLQTRLSRSINLNRISILFLKCCTTSRPDKPENMHMDWRTSTSNSTRISTFYVDINYIHQSALESSYNHDNDII